MSLGYKFESLIPSCLEDQPSVSRQQDLPVNLVQYILHPSQNSSIIALSLFSSSNPPYYCFNSDSDSKANASFSFYRYLYRHRHSQEVKALSSMRMLPVQRYKLLSQGLSLSPWYETAIVQIMRGTHRGPLNSTRYARSKSLRGQRRWGFCREQLVTSVLWLLVNRFTVLKVETNTDNSKPINIPPPFILKCNPFF